MVLQEVGYRILDSPSDNLTIKKLDNPLPVRALLLDDFSRSSKEFPVPVATKDLSNSIEGI